MRAEDALGARELGAFHDAVVDDGVGGEEGVDDEGGAALALEPGAVAAVGDEGRSRDGVADVLAGTAA